MWGRPFLSHHQILFFTTMGGACVNYMQINTLLRTSVHVGPRPSIGGFPQEGAPLHAPRYEEWIAARHCMNPPREGRLAGEGVPSGMGPRQTATLGSYR